MRKFCFFTNQTFSLSRAQEYAKTKAADCSPLPSLVVCPPTLTGHWVDEVGKFCSKEFLNPLHYMGPPLERMRYASDPEPPPQPPPPPEFDPVV